MEGLIAIIKEYERKGLIKCIQVAREAPTVTYMFFIDDSYIYFKAIGEDATQLVNILKTFEIASGEN